MTRPDIFEIARYATDKGCIRSWRPAVISSRRNRLADGSSGIKAISISIDGPRRSRTTIFAVCREPMPGRWRPGECQAPGSNSTQHHGQPQEPG